MAGDESGGKYLTLQDIAERLGWSINTARTMQHRANSRRAAGKSRPGDLPPPDHRFARTPVWLVETIEAWEKRRPGQGAGGGPKAPKQ
ncbi:hypothetical protein E2F47_25865 [Mycobacterium eburneum]|nr:hypothetical protein [Mycobacterium eburneum]TDH47941.1 hypothetical protein E2F47_25865 [Mycobacterium eburneum]